MAQRPSTYYRERDSLFIVNETRGVPFKIVSLLLAFMFFITGVRDIVAPSYPISGTDYERERLGSLFVDHPDENVNKHKDLWYYYAGLVGLFALLNAALRFVMATTSHVAELYQTMQFIVGIDFGLLALSYRMGITKMPIFYVVMLGGAFIYETYILSIARKAHLSRMKMKKITMDD